MAVAHHVIGRIDDVSAAVTQHLTKEQGGRAGVAVESFGELRLPAFLSRPAWENGSVEAVPHISELLCSKVAVPNLGVASIVHNKEYVLRRYVTAQQGTGCALVQEVTLPHELLWVYIDGDFGIVSHASHTS